MATEPTPCANSADSAARYMTKSESEEMRCDEKHDGSISEAVMRAVNAGVGCVETCLGLTFCLRAFSFSFRLRFLCSLRAASSLISCVLS